MKALILTILTVCFSTGYAMRCGTSVITDGDTVEKMISLCGDADIYGQSYVYKNKDSDGMTYIIHASASGIIDNISFTKGF